MRTLGIDPGTALMGFGLVEGPEPLRLIEYGCLTTASGLALPRRLLLLYQGLDDLIRRHRPDQVAVEQLYFSRNTRTAMAVGQARGVALLAAAAHGLEVAEYSPQQVKQAVAGFGGATKEQVQEMIRLLLRLPSVPQPDDAADALAIAICHTQFARAAALGIV
jgi:crossover junction endodeoxyribonuclease RuvC